MKVKFTENYFIYKFGKKEDSFKAPDRWSDVSFKTYLEFTKIVEDGADPLKIYSLFTGLPISHWEKPHSPKLYNALDNQLNFISEEPRHETPTHIERNGVFYEVSKDFLNLPLGKYRDMIEIISTILPESESNVDQISVFPKLISVIACKTYENEEDLDKIAKEIELMPCDVVYSLGCFFLKKLTELSNGTKKRRSMWGKIKYITKRVMIRLVAISVIFTAYILSPMEILRSIKRFFQKTWVRCIGGNSYKVVSINQRKRTLI
jgi:hypothetical protein